GDNTSSLSIDIASGPTGASFASGSTTLVAVSSGVATFNNLILETAGSGYTLEGTDVSPSLLSAPSSSFTVLPHTATQLVFDKQPNTTTAGEASSTSVTVKIDAPRRSSEPGDNTSSLSIDIATGPSGATFASGSTTTAIVSSGVATFNNLVLDTSGSYTIQA